MKKIILIALFLTLSLNIFAQTDCEFSSNVTDSIGTYKSTKEYLMHERVFGNSQTSIFFSLINADGLLSLNIQMISKSSEFIAAKCFDKNSKIYIFTMRYIIDDIFNKFFCYFYFVFPPNFVIYMTYS